MRTGELWGPVAACMAAIFWLSSQNVLPAAAWLPGLLACDWMQHGIAYGVLAVLTLRAASGGAASGVGSRTIALAWLVAVVYGVSDEWHQSFVPGRTPDLADVLADGTGAAVGLGAGWAWSKIRRSS